LADSGRPDHILVWMRDSDLADRLRHGLERHGFATTWAAALPEAIAAIDRDFPCAIACTLRGRTPSLMDLETIHAYQTLGHRSISLAPVPVWALAPDPSRHASEIEVLGMPVRLLPYDLGAEGLLREMLRCLRPEEESVVDPLATIAPSFEPQPVLLLLSHAGEAAYLARYLRARRIDARVAGGPEEAWDSLTRTAFGVLVGEEGAADPRWRGFWTRIRSERADLPIVLIASGEAWLSQVSPLSLPRGLACTLRKPVRAQILEACLRRLLRVRAPAAPDMTLMPGDEAAEAIPRRRAAS